VYPAHAEPRPGPGEVEVSGRLGEELVLEEEEHDAARAEHQARRADRWHIARERC
jgi:hypothetical protein